MLEFLAFAQQCAPHVHPDTLQRVVHVESSFNPYAIGVVGNRLERQPRNAAEAIATAQWLERHGFNYSVGLAQVNKSNFAKYGLHTLERAFEPCANLRAGADILADCYARALRSKPDEQVALRAAISCYYSGNFTTGFKHGYVLKVVNGTAVSPTDERHTATKAAKKNDREVMSQSTTRPEAVPVDPHTPQSALMF